MRKFAKREVNKGMEIMEAIDKRRVPFFSIRKVVLFYC